MKILIAGDTADFPFLQRKLRHFLKRIKSKPILLYRNESPLREFLVKFTFLEGVSSMIYQSDEKDDDMIAEARALLLFKGKKIDGKLLEKAQKAKLQIRIIEE